MKHISEKSPRNIPSREVSTRFEEADASDGDDKKTIKTSHTKIAPKNSPISKIFSDDIDSLAKYRQRERIRCRVACGKSVDLSEIKLNRAGFDAIQLREIVEMFCSRCIINQKYTKTKMKPGISPRTARLSSHLESHTGICGAAEGEIVEGWLESLRSVK